MHKKNTKAPLLQMESVNFHYPKTEVNTLHNINLTINVGDYVAIVGTSGSGKSTLLSILGLLNKPTLGEYKILGKSTQNLTDTSIALLKNHEIGFVFQNFNLLNHLNVFDNVVLPLTYNKNVPRKNYRSKVLKALTQVGMEEYLNRFPDQLSGGQQQRIAIARSLINDPSLILADEPTGNLDSQNSEQIFNLLSKLNDQGKTICLITHDMEYAQQAQQQWLIKDGCLSHE